jgi:hypothetical protein
MEMQAWLWIGTAMAAAITAGSATAEYRQSRRTDLDQLGWFPWPKLTFAAMFAGLILLALAIKS